MTSRIKKRKVKCKKKKFEVEILSQDCERTLTSDIRDSVCYAWENSSTVVGRGRLRTHHLFIFIHNDGPYDSGRCEIYMGRPLSEEE